MTTTYKNFAAHVTGSPVDVYTAPAEGSGVIVLDLHASNTTSSTVTCTVTIMRAANNTAYSYATNLSIPPNSAVGFLTGKLVLNPGDILRLQGTASSSSVIGSVAEMS